jgi:hypothetical protein
MSKTIIRLEAIKHALNAIRVRTARDEATSEYIDIVLKLVEEIERPRPDDITISWASRADYNRHKVAIEVQDAGNLRALAREFVKVVDQASDETKSTEATWHDPAVVLFVNKFESLCRSEARFSEAYADCKRKANLD